jgi:hypothetical protein
MSDSPHSIPMRSDGDGGFEAAREDDEEDEGPLMPMNRGGKMKVTVNMGGNNHDIGNSPMR